MAKIAGNKLNQLFESTKDNIGKVGEKLSQFQEYFVKQLKMADCCNNVQIEPSLLTGNLLDVSGNGIARPTIASAAYAGRHTANHSMNVN